MAAGAFGRARNYGWDGPSKFSFYWSDFIIGVNG